MPLYIQLDTLQKSGEERAALVDSISEALSTAVAEDIGTVKVVLYSFRVFPDGREDHGRPAPPLTGVQSETADAEQVVNKIVQRFERAVGQGFKGRMLVAVEDPVKRGQPVAGVWERYVTGAGNTEPDAYGASTTDAYGSRQPDPPAFPHHQHQPALPFPGGGMGGPPPPPRHALMPEPVEPPDLGGSSFLAGTRERGYDAEYDPGAPGETADREMVRSIMGANERRLDGKDEEVRYYQQQNTHMLEYFLRQNAQVMQMLQFTWRISPAMTGGPVQSGGGGGSGYHPLGELAAAVLTGILGGAEQPQTDAPPPPPAPPRFRELPTPRPNFYQPTGDMNDLGGSFYAGDAGPDASAYAGSHDGRRPDQPFAPPPGPDVPPPGFDGSRPPTREEWSNAFAADSATAMEVASELVPAPFRGILKKGASKK